MRRACLPAAAAKTSVRWRLEEESPSDLVPGRHGRLGRGRQSHNATSSMIVGILAGSRCGLDAQPPNHFEIA